MGYGRSPVRRPMAGQGCGVADGCCCCCFAVAAAAAADAYAAYVADAPYTAITAAAAAAFAFAFAAADAAVYREYDLDRQFLEPGGTAQELALRPLWRNGMPETLETQWLRLREYLEGLNQDWEVWTKWYEERLSGNIALIAEIEIGDPDKGVFGRTTFPPEAYKNPASLNAKLKAVIDDYWAKNIEKIVKATPLAETLELNEEGLFEVTFLPITDLMENNIGRLKEAIPASIGGNGFAPTSKEIEILQDLVDSHLDNPQRIYDECQFMHLHINEMIEKGVLDKTLGVGRLLNALNIVATDIQTHESKVREVIKKRSSLNIHINNDAILLPSIEFEIHKSAIEPVLSDRLDREVDVDIKDIMTLSVGRDRADAMYRLMSRYSRMVMEIYYQVGAATLSNGTIMALVHAQPHLEKMITLLRPHVLGL